MRAERPKPAASRFPVNGALVLGGVVLRGCLVVAVCIALGALAGFGLALALLEIAEGDARGGEMLLLGFLLMAGSAGGGFIGLGLVTFRLSKRHGETGS